jgi:hypothetical protein
MGIGEVLFKVLVVVFGTIGAFNLGLGCILTIEKISKKLQPKWIYIYIISTSLGIVALLIISKQFS